MLMKEGTDDTTTYEGKPALQLPKEDDHAACVAALGPSASRSADVDDSVPKRQRREANRARQLVKSCMLVALPLDIDVLDCQVVDR